MNVAKRQTPNLKSTTYGWRMATRAPVGGGSATFQGNWSIAGRGGGTKCRGVPLMLCSNFAVQPRDLRLHLLYGHAAGLRHSPILPTQH
jgi:hypothetical protein